MPRVARVLAVDDDPEILSMLREFLLVKGYEVLTALSAEDAFRLLSTTPQHVVLLDLGMPNVSGMTALRHIRTLYPRLPVVIVSANTDVDVVRAAVEAGAFRYVAKPYDYVILADALEAALASRGGGI